MHRNRKIIYLLLIIALLLACDLPTHGDFTPTETAIAAKVMTQVANTHTPSTAQPQIPQVKTPVKPGQPPQPGGQPQFNPFESMDAAQKDCLLQVLGQEIFEAITTFQRPPEAGEIQALQQCGLPGFNGGQPGQPPPGGNPNQGPYYHQVMLARSADGLNWETFPDPIREHASVPEIAFLESGSLMIYFVDGTVDNLAAMRLRADAIPPWENTPAGANLPPTFYQPEAWEEVELSIDYPPAKKMVDPDLVFIPNAVTRLFFFGSNTLGDPGKQEQTHAIYSAMGTSDGAYFAVDMGERISLPNITDPSVVYLPDDTWLMALSRSTETVLAHSEDGGTFSETGVVVKTGGVPELVVLPDGSLRLYVTTSGGIASLLSGDGGHTWSEEHGLRIPAQAGNVAADPSVILIPDGSWLMAWKRVDPATTTNPSN